MRGVNVLGQDILHALRLLSVSPGFVAAAVLSLAIGIGANTSIFSVVNALLLNPLPYKDADRLVILWNRSPGLDITRDWFSPAQYFDIKNGYDGFEQLAIAFGADFNFTAKDKPERVGVLQASSNLLPMLGADAVAGRLFLPEDDVPGSPATAILSYGMWARRFGCDPDVIGKPLSLDGAPYQVIGVLPQSFSLPKEVLPTLYGTQAVEIFLPLPLASNAPEIRGREDFNILGKLKRGVTLGKAQAAMNAITASLRREFPNLYPPNGELTFSIVPLLEEVVGDVRRSLNVLLASVVFVLLIACANVANLSLVRAVARQKEIALRMALGASHLRIIRQLLTESLILAVAGGSLGILLAAWSLDGIRIFGPDSIPRLSQIRIDGRVLAFTLIVSAITGVLFGLVPALRVTRLDLHSTLKEGGRDAMGANAVWGRGHGILKLLVVGELALSVVLLIGAGLLVLSFVRLQSVHPGFRDRNLLTFGLTPSGGKYSDPQAVLDTFGKLWERLEGLPGVIAAGGGTPLPLTKVYAWTQVTVEGRTPLPGEKFINADERIVAARYFQAMEIPLLAGRYFDERDQRNAAPVVIVDEKMARDFWPDMNPIGKRIRRGGPDSTLPWLTVVGVVGRVKHDALDSDPRITFYLPYAQHIVRMVDVAVRSENDAAALTAPIQELIHELDPDLPMYRVRTMETLVEESLAPRRFSMVLLGIFAGIALLLAAVGIYGVMAYLVGQGAREIGIRLAMGATPQRILRLILGEGMRLAFLGALLGLAGAYVLTRFMESLLFETAATDVLTLLLTPVLLLGVALLACAIPARRAARLNPMATLRCE
jgi:predicted permease